MELFLTAEEQGVAVLACAGDVITGQLPDSRVVFTELLGPEAFGQRVVIDLGRVHFLDTGGIGWLLNANRAFGQAGGLLVLCNLPPLVLEMLRLLKLPAVLHLAADKAAAIHQAQGK